MFIFKEKSMVEEPQEEQRAAIEAELVQYRTFKAKPYLEIVFSVPIEREKQVKDALGYIRPGESIWCAVARLTEQPETV